MSEGALGCTSDAAGSIGCVCVKHKRCSKRYFPGASKKAV